MADIQNRADIELLVNSFYDKVRDDDMIGHIFTEVAAVSWIEHLPKMYQFWETLLLDRIGYKGSPVAEHVKLSRKTSMEQKHFDRWLQLWKTTVDELFNGPIAEEAKKRADYMAMLMRYKIDAPE
ncbi:MAG: group III truncated hemoglobin [Nonlabens sp.]